MRITLGRTAAAIVVVVLIGGLAIFAPWYPKRHALQLEPAEAELMDRVYPEFEMIQSQFRLTNQSESPVLIKGIQTSCSCTAAAIEPYAKFPVLLPSHQSMRVNLQINPRAKAEDVQTFRAMIASEQKGRALPERDFSLRVRVEDPLKAVPPSLSIALSEPERQVSRRLDLVTQSKLTKVGRLEVRTSHPRVIQATLRETKESSPQFFSGVSRFFVETTLSLPEGDSSLLSGSIDVLEDGRVRIHIPVESYVKLPYRLSQEVLDVRDLASNVVDREIFYETYNPLWKDLEVQSVPKGVELSITRFDDSSQKLKIRVTKARADAKSNRAANSKASLFAVLKALPIGREIRISIVGMEQ